MRATLEFSNPTTGAKARSALWYAAGSGATPPTLANISSYATSFKTAYTSACQGMLCGFAQLDAVVLKYVAGSSEVEGGSTGGPVAGLYDGECLPEEVVVCIIRRTGLKGRSNRGRIFFPFISEDAQADGELNEGGLTAANALATMVKSNVVHAGGTWIPQTPNWVGGILNQVVQAGAITSLCSRRDRRFPKQLTYSMV